MQYQFNCEKHGEFEVSQPMMSEHTANCPQCNKPAQRIFSTLQWLWAGSVFRPDGSLRQEEDYACLKG